MGLTSTAPYQSPSAVTRLWRNTDFSALCYTLLPLLLALRYVNSPPDHRTYGPSFWFLNYQHGFMRRALVGQLFSHFSFISWRHIFVIEAVVLACGVALTYMAFRSLLFGSLDERKLCAFILAAPAFLPHMATMGGELDNFLYIVLVLACCVLTRLPNSLGLVATTFFTVLALTIHEGFLLMFYPLVFVILLHLLHRRKISTLAFGLHCAVVLSCFVGLSIYGGLHGAPADLVATAQQRTDMPIEPVVLITMRNTIRQQIAFVRPLYTASLVSQVSLTLLLSIPYFLILWKLLTGTIRRQSYGKTLNRLITATFFIPLCLLPLGHDIMRWLAALCINMSLYVLFLYQESRSLDSEREATPAFRRWASSSQVAATFLYLLVLGPWGLFGNHLLNNIKGVLLNKPLM